MAVWVRADMIVNSSRVFDLGFDAQSYGFLTPRTGKVPVRPVPARSCAGEPCGPCSPPLPSREEGVR